jgi:uncharacterized protein involved in exopolysaccharide biosynthesis
VIPDRQTAVPVRTEPPPVPQQEIAGADADLFDYGKLRDYLGFGLRAVRRHRALTASVTVALVGLVAVALAVLPKTYHCEIKIQAQRNQVIGSVAGMTRPWDYELPTAAATDLIIRTDNLRSLVRKTDLIHAWDATRAPLLRLKDALLRRLRGEIPDDQKEEAMIGTLEQRLSVKTTEDTVTIGVDWPDARTAYRLIQAAHENFLEARQYKEVSALSEAVGLLQGRALEQRNKVDAAVERMQRLRSTYEPRKKSAAVVVKPPTPPRPVAVDPDLERLRTALRSKRQVIAEMEDFRSRRMAELASRLAEMRQVYSDFHPAVVDLQQTIDQQKREENPQLIALRQEYQKLEEEYERRGGSAAAEAPDPSASSGMLPAALIQLGRSEDEPPEVEEAKAELKHEIGRYSTLAERIEQAQLEVETQRAAFAYRYGVLRPAAVPASPVKPKKAQMLLVGLIAGLLLGVAAAILADLLSGRVLEPWQVVRQLGVPVLGEIALP